MTVQVALIVGHPVADVEIVIRSAYFDDICRGFCGCRKIGRMKCLSSPDIFITW